MSSSQSPPHCFPALPQPPGLPNILRQPFDIPLPVEDLGPWNRISPMQLVLMHFNPLATDGHIEAARKMYRKRRRQYARRNLRLCYPFRPLLETLHECWSEGEKKPEWGPVSRRVLQKAGAWLNLGYPTWKAFATEAEAQRLVDLFPGSGGSGGRIGFRGGNCIEPPSVNIRMWEHENAVLLWEDEEYQALPFDVQQLRQFPIERLTAVAFLCADPLIRQPAILEWRRRWTNERNQIALEKLASYKSHLLETQARLASELGVTISPPLPSAVFAPSRPQPLHLVTTPNISALPCPRRSRPPSTAPAADSFRSAPKPVLFLDPDHPAQSSTSQQLSTASPPAAPGTVTSHSETKEPSPTTLQSEPPSPPPAAGLVQASAPLETPTQPDSITLPPSPPSSSPPTSSAAAAQPSPRAVDSEPALHRLEDPAPLPPTLLRRLRVLSVAMRSSRYPSEGPRVDADLLRLSYPPDAAKYARPRDPSRLSLAFFSLESTLGAMHELEQMEKVGEVELIDAEEGGWRWEDLTLGSEAGKLAWEEEKETRSEREDELGGKRGMGDVQGGEERSAKKFKSEDGLAL